MPDIASVRTSVPYARAGLVVRLCYLLFALGWRLLGVLGLVRRGGTVVLCYHGILPGQKERFKWQMGEIAGRAITSTSGSVEGARGGKHHTTTVCVTFDDAFANLLTNALPALEEHQIPALIFAVADNLGCEPRWQMPNGHPEAHEQTMAAEQLADLSKRTLVRIGSHTLSHANLTQIPTVQAEAELTGSKQRLEELCGGSVEALAFPYGAYNQEVVTLARASGYRRVYTLDPVLADLQSDSPCVGRFSMSPDVWRIEFRLTCMGAYAWLSPWRRFLNRLRGMSNRSKRS